MNILCKLFGHQPPIYAKKGWYSPGEEYARVERAGVDGCGVEHATVHSECPRCGEVFKLARIHIPLPHNVTRKEQKDAREIACRIVNNEVDDTQLSQESTNLARYVCRSVNS